MQDFILPSNSFSTEVLPNMAEASEELYYASANPGDLRDLKQHYASLIIEIDRMRGDILKRNTTLRYLPQGWSIREHLGFLINSDRDIWHPRIRRMIDEERPVLEAVSVPSLLAEHQWQQAPIEDTIAQLMRTRWNASSFVHSIPDAAYFREAIHPKQGTISLQGILYHLVSQDAVQLAAVRDLLAP